MDDLEDLTRAAQDTEPKRSALDFVKNYLSERKHQVVPAVQFVKHCISAGANMREKSNAFDWANFAFSAHQSYKETIGTTSAMSVFKDDRRASSPAFARFIVGMIKDYYLNRTNVLASKEAETAYNVDVHGITIGWIESSERGYEGLWVRPEVTDDMLAEALRKVFWEKFSGGRALVKADQMSGTIVCENDVSDQGFVNFKRCDDIHAEVQKFLDRGYSRSILFHGPPGSGKSNLVKGLCHKLGNRTLRFENLSEISTNLVSELIYTTNPKCVVMEDLDHLDEDDANELLHKLEDINKKNINLLATANEVKKLNNAIVRPERFDVAYEIKTLDPEIVRKMVGDDEKMYEMVRSWPVVFIKEAMKRREVLGDEATFEDLKDRIANLNQDDYALEREDAIKLSLFRPKVG